MAFGENCEYYELQSKFNRYCNLFIVAMIAYLLLLNEGLRLPKSLNRCCVFLGVVSSIICCTIDPKNECMRMEINYRGRIA